MVVRGYLLLNLFSIFRSLCEFYRCCIAYYETLFRVGSDDVEVFDFADAGDGIVPCLILRFDKNFRAELASPEIRGLKLFGSSTLELTYFICVWLGRFSFWMMYSLISVFSSSGSVCVERFRFRRAFSIVL